MARRALITGGWNNEDGSGELRLMGVEAGGPPVVLATSVPQFVAGGPVDGAAPLAYTVRKRFDAPEDGLDAFADQHGIPAPLRGKLRELRRYAGDGRPARSGSGSRRA